LRSRLLLALAILVLILLAYPIPAQAARTWLIYDNGWTPTTSAGIAPTGPTAGYLSAVLFSLPGGWSGAKVLIARYWIYDTAKNCLPAECALLPPVFFGARVYDANLKEIGTANATIATPIRGPGGWFDVDLSGQNIIVTGNFYVGIEWTQLQEKLAPIEPSIGYEWAEPSYHRSYSGFVDPQGKVNFSTNATESTNLMIRVEVEPYNPPATGDFAISVLANSLTVNKTDTWGVIVEVHAIASWAWGVTLNVTGLPENVTGRFAPPVVEPPPGGIAISVMMISVGAEALSGTYQVTIAATALNATVTRSVPFTLIILPTTSSIAGSNLGLAFAFMAIGLGVAAAGAGVAVAISRGSEVFEFGGYYYCKKHRVPLPYVERGLWCPVEQRRLRTG